MEKKTTPQNYQRTVLPNGVRLLLIPVAGVESIATAVMVGVGSRYETPQINGISHFLEHMVFKGTKKYPTTDDVNAIERIGGLQNAYTDIDVTSYHNKVLASDWKHALEINKELALKPLLEQKHVDQERNVIIEEMKRYEDEPAAKAEENFHELLYAGTKLGMRIIGTQESLSHVASSELKDYHDRWYKPEKIVVVLAGQIQNSESKIQNVASDWFGPLKGKVPGEIEVVTESQTRPAFSVVTKPDAQQAHWVLGVRTFARNSPDRFAWSVFNLLMGVSFTSRLFREIREKRGLCYQIRSSSSSYADVGSWSIYAGVGTTKVEESVSATLAELAKVIDRGVSADEVAVAKKRLKTILAFKSEDPEFFSEYYGRQEVFGEPLLTLEDYIARIEAVTAADINRLVRKYITQKTLNLSLVWSRGREEKVEKLLRI